MPTNKILVVHPFARTTFFLDKIRHYIKINFPDEVYYFNVKPNDYSHEQCLERIKQHSNDGLIIFLGHGRSDCLHGGRSDKAIASISEAARNEFPDEYYNNESFIDKENIDVFKNKKVFCLACNSNGLISDYAINNGSLVFLGFGDIPTSVGEFKKIKDLVSNKLISAMKGEINYIIKRSLVYALKNNYTFEGLKNIIYLITNQRIVTIKRNKFKHKNLLADSLYFMKTDIVIKGDKNIKLIG